MRVMGSGRFDDWRKNLMKIGDGTIETDQDGNILLPSCLIDSNSTTTSEMIKKAIEFVYGDVNICYGYILLGRYKGDGFCF